MIARGEDECQAGRFCRYAFQQVAQGQRPWLLRKATHSSQVSFSGISGRPVEPGRAGALQMQREHEPDVTEAAACLFNDPLPRRWHLANGAADVAERFVFEQQAGVVFAGQPSFREVCWPSRTFFAEIP